jgi:hypothetical protein
MSIEATGSNEAGQRANPFLATEIRITGCYDHCRQRITEPAPVRNIAINAENHRRIMSGTL